MTAKTRCSVWFLCWVLAAMVVPSQTGAVVRPERDAALAQAEFSLPELQISDVHRSAAALSPEQLADVRQALTRLGVSGERALLDLRSGRYATLMPSTPILPGTGVGNEQTWDALGVSSPKNNFEFEAIARDLFVDYLRANQADLRIDMDELAQPVRVTVHDGGDLVQIHLARRIAGVPVRDSYGTAVLNHGNLILLGFRNWGDMVANPDAALSRDEARLAAQAHLAALPVDRWGKSYLTIVPTSAGDAGGIDSVGSGLGYRLAWALRLRFADDLGNWEALVDAHSGEVLSFTDTNQYATAREVVGGVLPVANDGMPPDGVEQPGWPMPWADVTTVDGATLFTDGAGNYPACVDGPVRTTLSGRFMTMNDNCGEISESSQGNIDLGISDGTDCAIPDGASLGNTHSSRSGFYEMNRIMEVARGQLPGNVWLQEQLIANMNIASNCNAFWDGAVNFFTSGGGCNNTGELAGVYDHEWGHGMDSNDATPGISNPGEGIPDVYAALRLNESCIGRDFRGTPCGGYGDPCISCTGVRDIDFAKRQSGEPHDFTWANASCGGGSHCRGYVYSEAVWDLWKRDLPTLYGLDDNSAHEVVTRLTYIGAGGVGTWYAGSPPFGGCAATSGYMQYLAADDDNGNTGDGTPHMSAIFDAFDRHEIACETPAVVDSGCAGAPASAPVVSVTPFDRGSRVTWDAVPGATKYLIFRTEGVFQCNFGRVQVGETTETQFVDDGLKNDFEVFYQVAAVGPSDACMGPLSSCTSLSAEAGANLTVEGASAELDILTGDGDEFLDNCEVAEARFKINNIGNTTLTNVQIVDIEAVSHPGVSIDTPLPITVADSLSSCAAAGGEFELTAAGLAFDDDVELHVEVTADELNGRTKTASLRFRGAETDFESHGSLVMSYEAGLDGWQLVQGTFDRTDDGGGADGTDWYFASSTFADGQCDQIVSPLVKLTPSSTLSLSNQFDIEDFSGQWWDRANVGLLDPATGERTPVDPDGGRLYNASGVGGSCGTTLEDGWAASGPNWEKSFWSPGALGAADVGGTPLRLAINYGTDGAVNGFGFWFDEVEITDFDLQVVDAQPNDCGFVVPDVNLVGSCPGPMAVEVTGLTPNGIVAVGIGAGLDGAILPSGPCQGERVDVSDFFTRREIQADANGRVRFTAMPQDGLCNAFVQAIDFTTCVTSDVVPVP